jgi:hypothetical protein
MPQVAWHLKDWIKNDQSVDESCRNLVADEVHKCDPLLIIADLANCTKHLVLENAKTDAAFGQHAFNSRGRHSSAPNPYPAQKRD